MSSYSSTPKFIIFTKARKIKVLEATNITYLRAATFGCDAKHSEPFLIIDIVFPSGEVIKSENLAFGNLTDLERFLWKRDLYALNFIKDEDFRPAEESVRFDMDFTVPSHV